MFLDMFLQCDPRYMTIRCKSLELVPRLLRNHFGPYGIIMSQISTVPAVFWSPESVKAIYVLYIIFYTPYFQVASEASSPWTKTGAGLRRS